MKTKNHVNEALGLEEISQSNEKTIYGGKSYTIWCCHNIPPVDILMIY